MKPPFIKEHILSEESQTFEFAGYLAGIAPSGSGFVDLENGQQAFVLPSLIRRMSLTPGDRVLCRLVPNFSDRATDRVPWRVIYATSLPKNGGALPGMEAFRARVIAFLEDMGGAWTTEELCEELSLEERFVFEALSRLEDRALVSSARLRRKRADGYITQTFWASDHDALIPVGAFDEDDEEDEPA